MNESPATSDNAPETPTGHPVGLYTLFFTEMWERLSFYGMRALLVLFMVDSIQNGGLGLTDATATAIYGLYTAGVYLSALPGGWIADRLLGARKAVWWGGVLITAGHFILAFPSPQTFFLGLLLLVLGTGMLKPNISTLVGQLYPEGGARRDAGFTIFYMGINLGAMLGPLVCSYLGEEISWHYGFAAAGVGMALGLVQFKLTQHHLGEIGLQPTRRPESTQRDWAILAACLLGLGLLVVSAVSGVLVIDPRWLANWSAMIIVSLAAAYFAWALLFAGLDLAERKRVVVIAVLFLVSALFWAGYEQAGSSLNLFAERYTQRQISLGSLKINASWLPSFSKYAVIVLAPLVAWMWGRVVWRRLSPSLPVKVATALLILAACLLLGSTEFEIKTGWFQSFSAGAVITLAPVVAWLWLKLARRGFSPSLPVKFALALLILAAGFLVMVFASKRALTHGPVWPTWLMATYILHVLGELCLSPVGLSSVTKLAPQRMVGQMMGVWFLATSLGNLLAGLFAGEVTGEKSHTMPDQFLFVVMILGGAGLVLFLCSHFIRKLMPGVE